MSDQPREEVLAFPGTTVEEVIVEGSECVYTLPWPLGWKGTLWYVVCFADHEPSGQPAVIAMPLNGPSEGRCHVYSPNAFATRFRLVSKPKPAADQVADPEPPDKVIAYGSGLEARGQG